MAGVELAFATVTVTKEVYLLSRFVVRTAKSAAHSIPERIALQNELDFEHLYIRSFGLLFLQKKGALVPHAALNQEWLRKIHWILDELRKTYVEYAKLAAEKYEAYSQLSPYLQPKRTQVLQPSEDDIDFEHFVQAVLATEQNRRYGLHNHDDETFVEQLAVDEKKRFLPEFDWRWALSEKKHLRRLLGQTREWTSKLKDLVQMDIAVNQRPRNLGHGPHFNDDVERLGLIGHAQVRGYVTSAFGENKALDLSGAKLQMPHQRETLTPGILDTGAGPEDVLVEMKPLPGIASDIDESNITQLAHLLALSKDTDLSTIPIKGYLKLADEDAYAFVFKPPPGAADEPPVTLYDLIQRPSSGSTSLSLTQRFKVAQGIARSLNSLHVDKWVHKSFRSRSIVFFQDPEGLLIDRPYLVNFEYSRSTSTATSYTYDDDKEKNPYRHPQRQRPPQKSFNQSHDLYALGLVLLEIGLWQTIATIKDGARRSLGEESIQYPETVSDYYIDVASKQLPRMMGVAYMNATVACLLGRFGSRVADPAFPLAVYDKVVQQLDAKRLLAGD